MVDHEDGGFSSLSWRCDIQMKAVAKSFSDTGSLGAQKTRDQSTSASGDDRSPPDKGVET
jgi:hypothetical protein